MTGASAIVQTAITGSLIASNVLYNQTVDDNNKIEKYLLNAIQTQEKISLQKISEDLGLDKERCRYIISKSPIKDLWLQTNHAGIKKQKPVNNAAIENKKDSEQINIELKRIITEAYGNNTPLTYSQVAKQLNITHESCISRIKRSKDLHDMWAQMEHPRVTEESENINQTIASIIHEAHKKNRTINYQTIANQTGLTKSAVVQRVHDNPQLLSLIAQTGYSFRDCFDTILKVPHLQILWKQIDHSKVKEETKVLSKEIKDILTDTNNNGKSLHINDIADFTQHDYNAIMKIIHNSEDLTELWEKNKKNHYFLLKQIHSSVQKKIPEKDISTQLNLEDEIFDNLMAEYNALSKIIETQQDKSISDEEYINWAILSKREYELITNLIFEKMGYEATATRYMSDGGVDVIAKKDGRTVIVECIHNLTKKERAKEVLALEGIRAANNIDKAILVTASGIHYNAKECAKNINNHNSETLEVLTLADMIKLAKKYGIDINKINFNNIEENNETMLDYEVSSWYFKKSDIITDKERKKWLNLSQKEYENKITNYFAKNGYNIRSISRTIGLNGFYLIEKEGEKTVIDCSIRNSIPDIDDIRSLYGCKSAYNADRVLFIGTSGVSSAEKSFIDLINKQEDKQNTFEIISLDKIIELIQE